MRSRRFRRNRRRNRHRSRRRRGGVFDLKACKDNCRRRAVESRHEGYLRRYPKSDAPALAAASIVHGTSPVGMLESGDDDRPATPTFGPGFLLVRDPTQFKQKKKKLTKKKLTKRRKRQGGRRRRRRTRRRRRRR